MNWKNIIVGGLVYFVATFIVSMVTGPLIHEGVLVEAYQANASFWRPELNEVPPDMAALMPQWLTTGLISALITAGIYDHFRSSLEGSGLVKGLKFGFVMFLINSAILASWSGVFNLPNEIWGWWIFEGALYLLLGLGAMGLVLQKISPE